MTQCRGPKTRLAARRLVMNALEACYTLEAILRVAQKAEVLGPGDTMSFLPVLPSLSKSSLKTFVL